MSRPRTRPWAAALSVAALAAPVLPQAQPPPAPPPGATAAGSAAATNAKPPPLGADDLDRLLEPFAGAPQDTLGVVLDACRYPSDLIDASRWAQQPEAARGPAKDSWPPTVRLLADRAPRTLDFLTRDLHTTSALGSAYQNQPNDVWLAYGRVTERQERSAEPQAPPAQTAESGRPPPPRSTNAGAGEPSAETRRAATPAAPAPRPAPSMATAPAAPVAQPAPQTVVVQPQPEPGPSAAGAALAGGVVGLGAGLLISELAHDDDGWGHGYPVPYAVPPPYMPYGGGGAYNAARDLQSSRISAAQQLQGNRQAFARENREDRQAFTAEQRQQRQAAESQRQEQRQSARADRQAQRQQSLQSSGLQRPGAGGAGRRDLATAGQSRPGERGPAAQRVATAHPAFQGGARPAGWGPAQGMSGDRLAAARARQPPGGFGGGRSGLRRR